MSLTASPKDPQALRHGTEATIAPEDDALHQGLGPRQLQMIAIGGAIGTGLFLGAGGRLEKAGYVERTACTMDKRGVNCHLTQAGEEFLRTAAPIHLDGVRRHVIVIKRPLSRHDACLHN